MAAAETVVAMGAATAVAATGAVATAAVASGKVCLPLRGGTPRTDKEKRTA